MMTSSWNENIIFFWKLKVRGVGGSSCLSSALDACAHLHVNVLQQHRDLFFCERRQADHPWKTCKETQRLSINCSQWLTLQNDFLSKAKKRPAQLISSQTINQTSNLSIHPSTIYLNYAVRLEETTIKDTLQTQDKITQASNCCTDIGTLK